MSPTEPPPNPAFLSADRSHSVPRTPSITQPHVRFMWSHPAHLLALGFGSGLSPVLPGTVGTLFGWLCFNALAPYLTAPQWGGLIVIGFIVGIWACEKTGRALGVADHGGMVWDEIIAIWLVLWLVCPASLAMQAAAVLGFRVFDMAKPGPIRYVERLFKGGFGVMIDDIVAAGFTLFVLAVWRFL